MPEIQQAISTCKLQWSLLGELRELNLPPCRIVSIVYIDLTGDGREEAIVPVAGLGGMGRLPIVAVFVYGYEEATLRLFLSRDTLFGPLWIYVANGRLAISETQYGPEEAAWCASNAELTSYSWNGRGLLLDAVETAPCNQEHPVFGRIYCPRA